MEQEKENCIMCQKRKEEGLPPCSTHRPSPSEEGICRLCKDGGFTVSPCPHVEEGDVVITAPLDHYSPQREKEGWEEGWQKLKDIVLDIKTSYEMANALTIFFVKTHSFIKQVRAEARQELLKELKEKVEGMKKEAKTISQFMKPDKYNEALDDFLQLLSSNNIKE